MIRCPGTSQDYQVNLQKPSSNAEFLVSLKSSDAISTFLQEKNEAIHCLLSESSRDRVESFTKLVWFDSLLSVESCINEKPDDIVVVINRQALTEATSSLH